MRRLFVKSVAYLLSATSAVVAIPVFTASCYAAPSFIHPVDGPIVRRFEQPLGPYAAGHRGIDYGVPAGTEVVASADGLVSFAGPVANDGLFVTVRHFGGIETTYSFMSSILVAAGQQVKGGEPLGLSGQGHDQGKALLHFGAKLGGTYIDPELLLFGNLDDISDLIALAPLEEVESTRFLEGGSFFGEPVRAAKAQRTGPGLFVSLGSSLARSGRWLWESASSLMRWSAGVASSAASLISNALRWTWNGARAAGGWVAREVATSIDLLRHVVDSVIDSFRSAWEAVSEAVKAAVQMLIRAVVGIWDGFERAWSRLWATLKRLPGSIWSQIERLVGKLLPVKFAKAALEQRKCQDSKVSVPRIPSPEQMTKGATPPPPPNDNIVVAVAGIGSWTKGKGGRPESHASIYQLDFRTLGYSEEDIFHFSYRGIEDREDERGPYRIHAPYTKEDTYKSIAKSAEQLGRQLREIQRRFPGRAIDLVAHSQGGLVARYYLTNLHRPDDPQAPHVDHFVTLATPHKGADAAQFGVIVSDERHGRSKVVLERLSARLGLPPPASEAALEMAENSGFLRQIEDEAPPSSVRATSIVATFDYVVTPPQSEMKGANLVTVDLPLAISSLIGAHSQVATSVDTRRLVYGSLSGHRMCTPLRNVLAAAVGATSSRLQDLAAAATYVSLSLAGTL